MSPIGKIFISYRREDSADATGRIYDRLKDHFGAERLVRDVDSIPPGCDFRQYLSDEVERCQVLVAVMGRHWLDVKNPSGRRRLDDPRDFVRIEIEAALRRNVPIIPVVVGGASFPDEDQMPPSLKDLVYRHGRAVRPDPDFHRDVDRLIASLNQLAGVGNKKSATDVPAGPPKIAARSPMSPEDLARKHAELGMPASSPYAPGTKEHWQYMVVHGMMHEGSDELNEEPDGAEPESTPYTHQGSADKAVGSSPDIPGTPQRQSARAATSAGNGEFHLAIKDTEAMGAELMDASSFFDRGVADIEKADYGNAIDNFSKAISCEPTFTSAFFNRGVAYASNGEHKQAIKDYSKAIDLDRTDSLAFLNRGVSYAATDDYDQALADYAEAIRLDPKNAEALNYMAWILATCPIPKYRNGDKAVAYAMQACERSGWRDANVLDTLAAAYAEVGEFHEAIKVAELLVEDRKLLYAFEALDAAGLGMMAPDLIAEDQPEFRARLELYKSGKPYREG